MTKTNLQCILILLMATCFLLLTLVVEAGTQPDLTPVQYMVSKGDTLWSLSQQYCPDDMDCREWIYEVEQMNGITGGQIWPGDIITILTEATP